MNDYAFKAQPSPKSKKHIQYHTLVQGGVPLITGGKEYLASDIEMQSKVGICTAISFVQNREKANGKKYSADFQYLLQKKYVDFNNEEGSSVYSALCIGNKIGLLPLELWTHTTQADRNLTYAEYYAKLLAIDDTEINRLIALCVDKIAGYAQIVDSSNISLVAQAINDSESGVLCRYNMCNSWWTNILGITTWAEKYINPLRNTKIYIGGHAIGMTNFDLNKENKFTMANTWSSAWCRNGSVDVIYEKYSPTEVWVILRNPIINKLNVNLNFGMTGPEVVNLQNALKIKGYFKYNSTGYFGILTLLSVKAYQKANGIEAIGVCGPKTRTQLNKDFGLC